MEKFQDFAASQVGFLRDFGICWWWGKEKEIKFVLGFFWEIFGLLFLFGSFFGLFSFFLSMRFSGLYFVWEIFGLGFVWEVVLSLYKIHK